MKKILNFLCLTAIICSVSLAKEILHEDYIMTKVAPLLKDAPVFVNSSSKKEVKGLKVNKELLKTIETVESPFYFQDNSGRISTVRVGDYIVSPISGLALTINEKQTLSTATKKSFEADYTSKDGSVTFDSNENLDLAPVDFTQVDEANNKVNEKGEVIQ